MDILSHAQRKKGSKIAAVKARFEVFAHQTTSKADLPHYKLEYELSKQAIGDCTGYRVLVLGQGSCEHARFAADAGASRVDAVETSEQLIQVVKNLEREAGRDVIHLHKADVATPLQKELPDLPIAGYDLVLAMWPWDHAGTFQEYVWTWHNVSTYLKPGGRVVGCRIVNPWCFTVQSGKYGAKCALIQQTEEKGVIVLVTLDTKPPFMFESVATEASLRGDTYVPNKLGITELQNFSLEHSETVKSDPGFWREFVEDPHFVVFTGKKSSQA